LEETTGIIAGLSQVGVKASTIGTGVSQLLKELAAPKDRLKNLLDHYGITLDQVNPKLHSFADIVQVFTEKNVAAEHILRALDSRVGRSLVASMTAGSSTFRTMTESVTGTSAAVLAYEKAMDGARARMNVLKQEFLAVVVGVGNSTSGVFSTLTELLTNMVRGLGTVTGNLLIFGGAATAAVIAVNTLTTACMANPVLLGLTVGILAFGGALTLLGTDFDDLRGKVDGTTEALREQATASQKNGKDGIERQSASDDQPEP
jgi:TP901 family phage tail tape measure protein